MHGMQTHRGIHHHVEQASGKTLMRESGSERMTETHVGQNTMQETERVM